LKTQAHRQGLAIPNADRTNGSCKYRLLSEREFDFSRLESLRVFVGGSWPCPILKEYRTFEVLNLLWKASLLTPWNAADATWLVVPRLHADPAEGMELYRQLSLFLLHSSAHKATRRIRARSSFEQANLVGSPPRAFCALF